MPYLKNNKFGLTLTTLIFAVAVLSLVQLILTNYFATGGDEIIKIESKINQLKEENQLLRSELSELSSLNRVASISSSLGFHPSLTSLLYLKPEPSLALK